MLYNEANEPRNQRGMSKYRMIPAENGKTTFVQLIGQPMFVMQKVRKPPTLDSGAVLSRQMYAREEGGMSNLLHMDKEVFLWINSHHNLLFDAILTPIAYAGEAGTIWVLTAIVLSIINKPDYRRAAVLLVVTVIVVDCVGHIMSAGFDRPRPYLTIEGVRQIGLRWQSGSFPSGHAHSSWAAAVILGSRWRKLLWPLVAFAVMTCYSRPYFGMHYPIDVLAGAALGIVGGSFAVLVDRWIRRIGRGESNGY